MTASPYRDVMIVLAYLWPLAIVPLLVETEDAEVQWHAKHGLVLMAAELLILLGFATIIGLVSMASFALGCALGVFVVFIWVAMVAVHLVAAVKGLNGTRLIVPGITEYAGRF